MLLERRIKMKKGIILLCTALLLTGCGEENKQLSKDVNDNSSSTTTTITTSTTTKKSTTKTTTTTKKTTTTSKKCTPKKFKHKYTYTYATESECNNEGYNNINYVYENVNSNVSLFGCEKITDECGDTYWGVYFRIWTGSGDNGYEKWYY